MRKANLKDIPEKERKSPKGKFGRFMKHVSVALGRRPECKACSNAYRNRWARARYVPKTGRRYRTRRDREAAAAPREPACAPENQLSLTKPA